MAHEEWGEGPWNQEDDHGVWVDPATDLDCMVNRGPSGALCGYVGVPPSHPAHGRHYNVVDTQVEVHGGLTYSDSCQEGGEICHVPQPGREHDIWWFGFDCAHFMDFSPGMEARLREMRARGPEYDARMAAIEKLAADRFPAKYRDWNYVVDECTQLAAQLAKIQ